MARIGSTVNMNVMGHVYEAVGSFMTPGHRTLGMALMIAAATCVFSFFCAGTIAMLDKRAENHGVVGQVEDGEEQPKISLKDVLHFPLSFWLVTAICVLYYACVFPFVAIALPYFMSHFGLSKSEAAALNSLIYIMSAPLAPCFGLLIDVVGFNACFVLLANCMCLTAHLLLAFAPITPWIGVAIIGISYSMLASSLWPMVSLLVDKQMLGTAYGLMQSWQNLGLAVIAIAVGAIAEKGWVQIEMFFAGCVSCMTHHLFINV